VESVRGGAGLESSRLIFGEHVNFWACDGDVMCLVCI